MHAGLRTGAKCDHCAARFDTKQFICECPALNQQKGRVLGSLTTSLDTSTLCAGIPHPPVNTWSLTPDFISAVVHLPQAFTVNIFTDGSADPPDIEHLTLSAWALAMALDCPDQNFQLVASGTGPSIWQNILRAKTYEWLSILWSLFGSYYTPICSSRLFAVASACYYPL